MPNKNPHKLKRVVIKEERMSYSVRYEIDGKQWYICSGLATTGSMDICIPIGELTGMSALDIGQAVLALLPIAVNHLEEDRREMAEQQDSAYYSPSTSIPQRTRRQHKAGFVYLLKGDDCYKIGRTKELDKRIDQLSTKLPFEVELIHTIKTDDMTGLEAQLHERFADGRINGEWFDLSEQDVKLIQGM